MPAAFSHAMCSAVALAYSSNILLAFLKMIELDCTPNYEQTWFHLLPQPVSSTWPRSELWKLNTQPFLIANCFLRSISNIALCMSRKRLQMPWRMCGWTALRPWPCQVSIFWLAFVCTTCINNLHLLILDSDAGKWGKWSEWSTCSSKYSWGTKIRYRFCDSPPPRYGGRFCEGPATESRQCGGPIFSTWDYFFGNRKDLKQAHNGTDVMAEVGPGCRCGCIIHLGASKPKRLLASSSQSCPGRSLWLVQVSKTLFFFKYFVLNHFLIF